MERNLIFDLGFHNGDDTDFYLRKGFKVIAVEANEDLVNQGQQRFHNEIKTGQLQLLNCAISEVEEQVTFYVNTTNSDWSSCFKSLAEIDGKASKSISVQGITIGRLFERHSVPYYMKVDIEGHDLNVAKFLVHASDKPKFVSFETNRREFARIYAHLFNAGYNQFQLINQVRNPDRIVPKNSDEGLSIQYNFTRHSSGLFGTDLPQEKWYSMEESITRYVQYKELKGVDHSELGLGWLDLHARLDG